MLHAVKIYGRRRCPRTLRAMAITEAMGMHFDFFDLDTDLHAAAWVRYKSGDAPTPTVMIGLNVFTNPAEQELRSAVLKTQMCPPVPATPLPIHR